MDLKGCEEGIEMHNIYPWILTFFCRCRSSVQAALNLRPQVWQARSDLIRSKNLLTCRARLELMRGRRSLSCKARWIMSLTKGYIIFSTEIIFALREINLIFHTFLTTFLIDFQQYYIIKVYIDNPYLSWRWLINANGDWRIGCSYFICFSRMQSFQIGYIVIRAADPVSVFIFKIRPVYGFFSSRSDSDFPRRSNPDAVKIH